MAQKTLADLMNLSGGGRKGSGALTQAADPTALLSLMGAGSGSGSGSAGGLSAAAAKYAAAAKAAAKGKGKLALDEDGFINGGSAASPDPTIKLPSGWVWMNTKFGWKGTPKQENMGQVRQKAEIDIMERRSSKVLEKYPELGKQLEAARDTEQSVEKREEALKKFRDSLGALTDDAEARDILGFQVAKADVENQFLRQQIERGKGFAHSVGEGLTKGVRDVALMHSMGATADPEEMVKVTEKYMERERAAADSNAYERNKMFREREGAGWWERLSSSTGSLWGETVAPVLSGAVSMGTPMAEGFAASGIAGFVGGPLAGAAAGFGVPTYLMAQSGRAGYVQRLLDSGMTREEVIANVRDTAGDEISGALTGAVMGAAPLASKFLEPVTGKVLGEGITRTLAGNAVEFAGINAGSTMASNIGYHAGTDGDMSAGNITEGVVDSAIEGLGAGAVLGGGKLAWKWLRTPAVPKAAPSTTGSGNAESIVGDALDSKAAGAAKQKAAASSIPEEVQNARDQYNDPEYKRAARQLFNGIKAAKFDTAVVDSAVARFLGSGWSVEDLEAFSISADRRLGGFYGGHQNTHAAPGTFPVPKWNDYLHDDLLPRLKTEAGYKDFMERMNPEGGATVGQEQVRDNQGTAGRGAQQGADASMGKPNGAAEAQAGGADSTVNSGMASRGQKAAGTSAGQTADQTAGSNPANQGAGAGRAGVSGVGPNQGAQAAADGSGAAVVGQGPDGGSGAGSAAGAGASANQGARGNTGKNGGTLGRAGNGADAGSDPVKLQRVRDVWKDIASHKPDRRSDVNQSNFSDDYYELVGQGKEIDGELGQFFDAHGIAKTDQFEHLMDILENGFDWERPNPGTGTKGPFTAPFKTKQGSGTGTAGGAYKDGLATIVSRPGRTLKDGIATVFIADRAEALIPALRDAFPHIQFEKISDHKQVLTDQLVRQGLLSKHYKAAMRVRDRDAAIDEAVPFLTRAESVLKDLADGNATDAQLTEALRGLDYVIESNINGAGHPKFGMNEIVADARRQKQVVVAAMRERQAALRAAAAQQVADRVAAGMAPHIADLERQKTKLEAKLDAAQKAIAAAEDLIKQKEENLRKIREDAKAEQRQQSADFKDQLKSQREQAEADRKQQVAALEEKLKQLKEKNATEQQERDAKFREQMKQLRDRFTQSENDSKQRIKALEEQLKNLKDETSAESREQAAKHREQLKQEREKAAAERKEQSAKYKEQLQKLKSQFDQSEADRQQQIRGLEKQLKDLKAQSEADRKQQASDFKTKLQQELAELKEEQAKAAEAAKSKNDSNVQRLMKQNEEKLEKLRSQMQKSSAREKAALQKQIDKAESTITKLRSELEKQAQTAADAKAKTDARIKELTDRIKALEKGQSTSAPKELPAPSEEPKKGPFVERAPRLGEVAAAEKELAEAKKKAEELKKQTEETQQELEALEEAQIESASIIDQYDFDFKAVRDADAAGKAAIAPTDEMTAFEREHYDLLNEVLRARRSDNPKDSFSLQRNADERITRTLGADRGRYLQRIIKEAIRLAPIDDAVKLAFVYRSWKARKVTKSADGKQAIERELHAIAAAADMIAKRIYLPQLHLLQDALERLVTSVEQNRRLGDRSLHEIDSMLDSIHSDQYIPEDMRETVEAVPDTVWNDSSHYLTKYVNSQIESLAYSEEAFVAREIDKYIMDAQKRGELDIDENDVPGSVDRLRARLQDELATVEAGNPYDQFREVALANKIRKQLDDVEQAQQAAEGLRYLQENAGGSLDVPGQAGQLAPEFSEPLLPDIYDDTFTANVALTQAGHTEPIMKGNKPTGKVKFVSNKNPNLNHSDIVTIKDDGDIVIDELYTPDSNAFRIGFDRLFHALMADTLSLRAKFADISGMHELLQKTIPDFAVETKNGPIVDTKVIDNWLDAVIERMEDIAKNKLESRRSVGLEETYGDLDNSSGWSFGMLLGTLAGEDPALLRSGAEMQKFMLALTPADVHSELYALSHGLHTLRGMSMDPKYNFDFGKYIEAYSERLSSGYEPYTRKGDPVYVPEAILGFRDEFTDAFGKQIEQAVSRSLEVNDAIRDVTAEETANKARTAAQLNALARAARKRAEQKAANEGKNEVGQKAAGDAAEKAARIRLEKEEAERAERRAAAKQDDPSERFVEHAVEEPAPEKPAEKTTGKKKRGKKGETEPEQRFPDRHSVLATDEQRAVNELIDSWNRQAEERGDALTRYMTNNGISDFVRNVRFAFSAEERRMLGSKAFDHLIEAARDISRLGDYDREVTRKVNDIYADRFSELDRAEQDASVQDQRIIAEAEKQDSLNALRKTYNRLAPTRSNILEAVKEPIKYIAAALGDDVNTDFVSSWSSKKLITPAEAKMLKDANIDSLIRKAAKGEEILTEGQELRQSPDCTII